VLEDVFLDILVGEGVRICSKDLLDRSDGLVCHFNVAIARTSCLQGSDESVRGLSAQINDIVEIGESVRGHVVIGRDFVGWATVIGTVTAEFEHSSKCGRTIVVTKVDHILLRFLKIVSSRIIWSNSVAHLELAEKRFPEPDRLFHQYKLVSKELLITNFDFDV
jgi:hypothetical protein